MTTPPGLLPAPTSIRSATDRTCLVDGCDRAHSARGYCMVHYSRWRRHGTTEVVGRGVECAMRRCGGRVDPPTVICRNCRVHLESGTSGTHGSCRIIGCFQAAHASLDGRPYCDDHFRWWPESMEPEMEDGTMLAPFGLVDTGPVRQLFCSLVPVAS